MEFPITDLFSLEESEQWIMEHFHPQGLKCPGCQASVERANLFRMTRKSKLKVYRCRDCQHIYNLYTNTVLQQHHLTPQQVILLLCGVLKGETTHELAAELELNYLTVLNLRRALQQNAERLQPETPVPDLEAESDELFQNAGKKGQKCVSPHRPPLRRANKRRGRGTYANDRPPVLGTIGRTSGQVRLRVVHTTQARTLVRHVHRLTYSNGHVFTDEYESYQSIERQHSTVAHGWARDDDADDVFEVHTNSAEGM